MNGCIVADYSGAHVRFDLRAGKAGFAYMAPSYDLPAPYTDMFGHYDFTARVYTLTGFIAETGGLKHTKALPDREWTADSLAGSGVR